MPCFQIKNFQAELSAKRIWLKGLYLKISYDFPCGSYTDRIFGLLGHFVEISDKLLNIVRILSVFPSLLSIIFDLKRANIIVIKEKT